MSSLDAWLSVADTVVVPPFSEIELFVSDNVTVGSESSFVIVPVPVLAVPSTALLLGLTSFTFTVSSGSSVTSPLTDTLNVALVLFAAMVKEVLEMAV